MFILICYSVALAFSIAFFIQSLLTASAGLFVAGFTLLVIVLMGSALERNKT